MVIDDVFRVRRAEQADYVAATEVLLRSRHASVPAIPPLVHLDEEAKKHFVQTVMPSTEVWVTETDGAISGVLVLNGNWIEQLYIDPTRTNHGLGTALIEQAKVERLEALELWTFESNRGAQRFYERHGFRAVGKTGGDNEEGEPDLHYRWVSGNVASDDRADAQRLSTGTLGR